MYWEEGIVAVAALAGVVWILRKLATVVWRQCNVDPFGRRCKALGTIDHPNWRACKEECPDARFLQVDVEIRGSFVDQVVSILLRSPDPASEEQHLQYYVNDGILFERSLAVITDRYVQPWRDKGYAPMAGAYSRRYV